MFPDQAQLALPPGPQVHLFVGNQLGGDPAFALDFIDAAGDLVASQTASLPPSWDSAIHDAERAHLPLADVAWIARTSESRERGGGSPQLFVYHLAVDRPAQAVAVRLRALQGAPLVLGLGQPGVGD